MKKRTLPPQAHNNGFSMNVKFTRGPTTTIAELVIRDSYKQSRTFYGDTKKHRGDRPDQQIGDLYAFSRALRAAAEYTEGDADFLVAIQN